MSAEEDFANWLIRQRTNRGWTRNDLAMQIDVTQATVFNWETRAHYPQPTMINRLEQVFNNSEESSETEEEVFEDDQDAPYGSWIEQARLSKGWSVAELATRAGVTAATIYNIESGRIRNPQVATKAGLEDALGEKAPDKVSKELNEYNNAGSFGQLYDFDPREDVPQVAGVYVFYDVSGRPVYVGVAENIRARMGQHRANSRWFLSRKIVNVAKYIPVREEIERRSIERLLIKFLGNSAILNRQHREGDQ